MTDRRLIEEWLPIADIGEECLRERRLPTSLPPLSYLHIWWARRPLVLSRAAVLASILPADVDREKFRHILGIHGDPVSARRRIEQSNKEGGKKLSNPYGYKRAFTYNPIHDRNWLNQVLECDISTISLLDPTAGGGSIPLESYRLGCTTLANDINPVASLILQATLIWPAKFGVQLLAEFQDLCHKFLTVAKTKYADIFPNIPPNTLVNGYLWARTIRCPYCSGLVPLSPNWRLASDGTGVKLEPEISDGPGSKNRICTFKIVKSVNVQSDGTVSRGTATCPYPDCRRVIDGDTIKTAGQSGDMGDQLYAIVYKINGKKEYRAPNPTDDNTDFIRAKLEEKMDEWSVLDIIPSERYNTMYSDNSKKYGVNYWRDIFSPRQLLCHGVGVETFHELYKDEGNNMSEMRKAAYGYLAIALDTMISYDNKVSRWNGARSVLVPTFDHHVFAFRWSYAEMSPLITGLGYEWAFKKTADSLKNMIKLVDTSHTFQSTTKSSPPTVTYGSADNLSHIQNESLDVVVMDPPYYDNVMYAELSDFFYVWLKRTAGIVFPDMFRRNLTDKENEAVANPVKFSGQKKPHDLARQDYQNRMAMIFDECRRVLKSSGIMTVMFMHKSTEAWNALATGIIEAGFYISSSWPVSSEAPTSMHIRDKAASKSTILLACRPQLQSNDTHYWEDVEPLVRESVGKRLDEFKKAGMHGVDTYLSAFGPALEVLSENWPMNRRTPREDRSDDPYSVVPEDALDAARKEVKQWRLAHLISAAPNKDLDPITAFFVLAWDAFESPKFLYDEALHLARAVNVDLERDVTGKFAAKESAYLVLWDSQKYNAHRKKYDGVAMLHALYRAAYLGRKDGMDAAIKYVESEHLDRDDSFVSALEAILEVLPPSSSHTGITLKGTLALAGDDFDALYNLFRLKFDNKIDNPQQLKLYE